MNKKELIDYLAGFVTENRFKTFQKVIDYRTKFITVVLEDIYQSHNASAVVRSCDCFGIQDVHIIENKNKYTVNPDVALGATKWLNLIKYDQNENNTLDAINKLKKQNYRIVATNPDPKSVSLNNFNLEKGKVALVFGSEMPGVSETIMNNADEFLYIPMYGLTESFNISVSVAICLFDLSNRLRKSKIQWELNDAEKEELLLNWLKNSIKSSDKIIENFLKHQQK